MPTLIAKITKIGVDKLLAPSSKLRETVKIMRAKLVMKNIILRTKRLG